jgi:hypothetical protein
VFFPKEAAMAKAKQQKEIVDPIHGEVFFSGDIDSLISGLMQAQKVMDEASLFRNEIREALTAYVTFEETKTVRLRGEKLRVTVTAPDESWDGALLKQILRDYPKESTNVIVPAGYRVAMKEWKKILHEKGPKGFEAFKKRLQEANKGALGLPHFGAIEELTDGKK